MCHENENNFIINKWAGKAEYSNKLCTEILNKM